MTGHQLKLIAIAAMLVDHIAWAFVQNPVFSLLMHTVGRITAPIMCFFIAEGYLHTHSVSRYLARLFIFAVAAQIPFGFFAVGRLTLFPLNVLYTLGLGLLALHSYEKTKHDGLRLLVILVIMLLALPGDWSAFAIVLCLIFHIFRGRFFQQTIGVFGVAFFLFVTELSLSPSPWQSLFHFGVLFSLPLLRTYNGERGGTKRSRWLFYIFYPAHLALLSLLQAVL